MPALEVSRGDNLERINVQRLVRYDALQATILILERSHLRDVADFHAAEFGLPAIEGRRTDAVSAAKILGCDAGFVFFKDADDLRFGKPGFFHGWSPSRPLASEFSTYFRSPYQATRHVLDGVSAA